MIFQVGSSLDTQYELQINLFTFIIFKDLVACIWFKC